MSSDLGRLVDAVTSCRLCVDKFKHEIKPIFRINPSAKILIASQAPGSKAHNSGIPFQDPSGDRLRDWMGIDKATFYDSSQIAILPMGFCFPGSGSSGDLPPPIICAKTWRKPLIETMPNIELELIIGRYAQKWHLPNHKKNLTETVKAWNSYGKKIIPLPHPSPRNNIWLKKNDWFERETLPVLKARVHHALNA